ncbi:MAG: hypothetical protein J6A23_09565 [Thermoguttaceae bacterium]|nr:hypothetical protein [Thermoguttaceae bacterium]
MTYIWTFLKHSVWRMFFFFLLSVPLFWGTGFSEAAESEEIAKLELTGDWSVRVTYGGRTQEFAVEPAKLTSVTDERVNVLPVFDPAGPPWRKARPMEGVRAQECAVRYAYLPGSLRVTSIPEGDADPVIFEEGTDYRVDVEWGNVGRLDGGRITQDTPVSLAYQFGKMRIDAIVRCVDGTFSLIQGESHVANPPRPEIPAGTQLLATVWISGRIDRLTEKELFPVSEVREYQPMFLAKDAIPQTYGKLVRGETVRILAWGDSVTACGYLPGEDRWQCQFVARLQKLFPNAKIELIHEGWGGRNTRSYRNAKPGSPKNYAEHVLAVKPDLVVMEFVNDSWMKPENVEADYSQILADFRERGMEWIICSPHYVRADWMGLSNEKGVDEDPRPYVQGLRAFAQKHGIALADASFYYGQLYRQGIPYSTLMTNNINHPNRFGMSLFADALMKLFEE